jgi:hypothetical protein
MVAWSLSRRLENLNIREIQERPLLQRAFFFVYLKVLILHMSKA